MTQSFYRKYLLAVLLVILAFNAVDRLALGLLLQDIKTDLQLSDTQLGVLTGIAFAAFYSLMGIPIARWADRGNRVTIISVTTALWSAAVALCGLTTTFVQLLLVRVGVAVGEAGCLPPAHSMIASHFTRAERPRATAFYMLGGPLSVVIGYFLAGWLNEFYGWRMTFIILGLPGVPLAILAWLTLDEPRNAVRHALTATSMRERVATSAQTAPQPTFREVCVTLWSNATFRHLLICFSVASFFNAGILQWKAAFFIRSHGLATGELGTWLTLIYGICGVAGIYLGGQLAHRVARHDERLQFRAIAIVFCSFGLTSALIYLSPNHYIAFALMAVTTLGNAATSGPLFATIQTLVPEHMRAMAVALLYLFANLIGMGLGPLAAGVLSDALQPWAGQESLRYALLLLSPGYAWAGWHVWQASRTVTQDLEATQREDSTPDSRSAIPCTT